MDVYSAHGASDTSLCPEVGFFLLCFGGFGGGGCSVFLVIKVQLSNVLYALSKHFNALVSLGRCCTLEIFTLARVGTFWTVWPHPHHTGLGHIPSPRLCSGVPKTWSFWGGSQVRTFAGYQFEKFHIGSAISRFTSGVYLIRKTGNKSAVRGKFTAWAQLHDVSLENQGADSQSQLSSLESWYQGKVF